MNFKLLAIKFNETAIHIANLQILKIVPTRRIWLSAQNFQGSSLLKIHKLSSILGFIINSFCLFWLCKHVSFKHIKFFNEGVDLEISIFKELLIFLYSNCGNLERCWCLHFCWSSCYQESWTSSIFIISNAVLNPIDILRFNKNDSSWRKFKG